MQVPHNAFVLVADGRKSLFFRNDGDGEFPNLRVEEAQERPNPRDIDQKTDLAGGAWESGNFSNGLRVPSQPVRWANTSRRSITSRSAAPPALKSVMTSTARLPG